MRHYCHAAAFDAAMRAIMFVTLCCAILFRFMLRFFRRFRRRAIVAILRRTLRLLPAMPRCYYLMLILPRRFRHCCRHAAAPLLCRTPYAFTPFSPLMPADIAAIFFMPLRCYVMPPRVSIIRTPFAPLPYFTMLLRLLRRC